MATYYATTYYSTSGGANGLVFEANAGAPAGTSIQLGDYIVATISGNPGGTGGVKFSQTIQNAGGGVSGTVQTLSDLDSVTTVTYDDPRVQDGQIIVILADNPDFGQMQLSQIPSKLIEAIGCEGFSDFDEILDRTNVRFFSTHYSPQTTLEALNVIGTANEKWMRINDTRNTVGFTFLETAFSPPNGTQREIEASVAIYLDTNHLVGATTMEQLRVEFINPSATLNQFYAIFEPNNAGTFIETNPTGLVNAGGTLGRIDTVVPIAAGALYYFIIRVRSESAVDALDGRLEMYINGDLVRLEDNIGLADDPITDFTGGEWTVSVKGTYQPVNGSPPGSQHLRNFSVFSGWTSDDGVPPDFIHVVDHKLNTVAGANVTNVGGVDESDSVTDNDDATYVQTNVANDPITLSQVGSVDPLLDSLEVRGVVARARISRSSLQTNTINVEASDGSNVFGDDDFVVTITEPSRENISVPFTVTGVVINPADVEIKLTNGS